MRLITISDIKLPVTTPESELVNVARKKLGGKIGYFAIRKKSLDARDKNNLRYVYTVECSKDEYEEEIPVLETLPKAKLPKDKVLVVGTGPAGLFCALRLLARGITPLVIERGDPVEEREKRINVFFREKRLDGESNIQFGEGGAGTFSDGKLNTQTHSPLNREVLRLFVKFGAPKEILWLAKPHIGSDRLKIVVKTMREYVISQGGEVLFRTRLEDVGIENGRVVSATVKRFNADTVGTNSKFREEIIPVSAVVLAVGHSARDTFEKLLARGISGRRQDVRRARTAHGGFFTGQTKQSVWRSFADVRRGNGICGTSRGLAFGGYCCVKSRGGGYGRTPARFCASRRVTDGCGIAHELPRTH